jgi:hypothetical protein
MEQKEGSTKPSGNLVESGSKGNDSRRTESKIPISVNTSEVTYAEASVGKVTEKQAEEALKKIQDMHKAAVEKVSILKASTSSIPTDVKPTNQQFLETKLNNCKKFVSTIEAVKGTPLEKVFLSLTPKDVLEWVMWMKNEKKTIEGGLNEMFAMYKINPEKLEKEEFEKIKLYFTCFHSIAHPNQ